MEKLLNYILINITGKSDFTIEEETDKDHINLNVKADPDSIGLIIGKGGNTIKAITTLLRVKASIEGKLVNINVSES